MVGLKDPFRLRSTRSEAIRAASRLDRRSLRNWFFFVGMATLTTIGLAAALLVRLGGRISSPWPWESTDALLLICLTAAIVLFAVYMTIQQRRVIALRAKLLKMNEEVGQQMRTHLDRLVALLNVNRTLATATNRQAVFDSITSNCLVTFGSQQASLFLYNGETQNLEVRSVSGHDGAAPELKTAQKIGRGLIGWVAQKRRPFILGRGVQVDIGKDPEVDAPLPSAAIIVPIILRDELIGVLSVSSSSPEACYSDEDLHSLQLFAETAGICCRHAEQTDWMRQTIQRLDATLQDRTASQSGNAA